MDDFNVCEYLVKPKLTSLEGFLEFVSDFEGGDLWITPSFGLKTVYNEGGIKVNSSNPYIKFSAIEKVDGVVLRKVKYREIYDDGSDCEIFRIIPTLADRLKCIEDEFRNPNLSMYVHGKNLSKVLDLTSKNSHSILNTLDVINNFTYGESLREFEDYFASSEMFVRIFN